VDWAEPENEVDDSVMSTVRILFLRNLMLSTSEETLRALFNRLAGGDDDGEVERVKKTKDFAFVHFATRAAAEKALANSNKNGGLQVIYHIRHIN
jgi:RNA recognition motif-containing protein